MKSICRCGCPNVSYTSVPQHGATYNSMASVWFSRQYLPHMFIYIYMYLVFTVFAVNRRFRVRVSQGNVHDHVKPATQGFIIASIKNICCLQEIYIHNNPLRYIHDDAFKGLGSLKTLSIRASDLLIPPSLNFISRTLTDLTLSSNDIAMFPNDYFDDCRVLKRFTIYMSKIVRAPRIDAIHGQLSELYLSANQIVDIRHLYGVVLFNRSDWSYFDDPPRRQICYTEHE